MDAYIEAVADQISESDSVNARIRPDIYDIEPNKTYEKSSLPKRMRYYHTMIDTKLLEVGADYESLSNVVIIVTLAKRFAIC